MMAMKVWHPNKILNLHTNVVQDNYALIILNRPLVLNTTFAIAVWNKASVRVLVDGGANRWLSFLENHDTEVPTMKIPELLTGDLDSVSDKSLRHFTALGTTVIKTPDQNATDFTKSLIQLQPYVISHNLGSIVVIVDTSGRIDHIMANINTMYKSNVLLPNVDVYSLCKSSISWMLEPGSHTIHVPKQFVDEQLWCSYVPFGKKCTITTTGFKWNLEDGCVEFGGLISTSNTYVSEILTIKTDGNLYWSMGINEKRANGI